MKMVLIRWLDTTSYGEKVSIKRAKLDKPTQCSIIGFLIKRDKHNVIVAEAVYNIPDSPEPLVDNRTVIPRGCVTDIVELYDVP